MIFFRIGVAAAIACLVSCQPEPGRNWQWAEAAVPADQNVHVQAYELSRTQGDAREYFNPGLTSFDGNLYVSVRTDKNIRKPARRGCGWERLASIGILDETGQLVGPVQPLRLPGIKGCDTVDDARLVACSGQLFAVYNAEVSRKRFRRHRQLRMFVARLDVSDPNHIQVASVQELDHPFARRDEEKNWTPFCYDNQLHFVYETTPHTILILPDTEAMTCGTIDGSEPQRLPVAKLSVVSAPSSKEPIYWEGGRWSGGTQALFDPALGEYVSFFHSYLKMGKHRLYYAGVYTFAATPPFAIQRYTPRPIALPAVTQRYSKYYRALFPMGLVDQGDSYLVSYGQDDTSAGMAQVDKETLFQSLVPVRAEAPL